MSPRQILLVQPSKGNSPSGNRTTALRWAGFLSDLGHDVRVGSEFDGGKADLLVALHAVKSAAAVREFHRAQPDSPIIVGLAGTDIYSDAPTSPAAHETLQLATRIVVLQREALDELTDEERSRAVVIHQSITVPHFDKEAKAKGFQVALVAHLREVKDPLLGARASRLLPAESELRIVHTGRAIEENAAEEAQREATENSRYTWLGQRSHAEALELMARSHAVLCSSKHEGGANVVTEAIALGVPVLASRIPGNTGLLGQSYPGLFPVGDERALAALFGRFEDDASFASELAIRVEELTWMSEPARERAAWKALLAEL